MRWNFSSSVHKRMSSKELTNVVGSHGGSGGGNGSSDRFLNGTGQETASPSWKLPLPHVFVATISSFIFGYHIGVVNEPLESISLDLGFGGNTMAEGLVVSMCTGGAFVGCMFSGWVADGIGRRRAFQMSSLPMIIGASMR
uniref:Putative plastidic glucose transporter 2 n=1 Tax=Anthurium amnicola TaxID=1678845 RepID=A0A1D1YY82_9ARAE